MTGRMSSTRGFKRTSQLLQQRIRTASESRGFAESRLLTRWAEIVGDAIAGIAQPVDVSFGRQGLGATLTVLTTGAQAPMLEMQKEQLRGKVNAVYGYNAISRIRITQTAPVGFSEGRVAFDHQPDKPATSEPDQKSRNAAAQLARPVGDAGLREALEVLGQNILSKQKH